MYYQGRDGGKPPSLHYTPLKHEGSKTTTWLSLNSVLHYTPLKQEGSKTHVNVVYFARWHYTPLKHEGSKTEIFSYFLNACTTPP